MIDIIPPDIPSPYPFSSPSSFHEFVPMEEYPEICDACGYGRHLDCHLFEDDAQGETA